jgi:hypothetical protein
MSDDASACPHCAVYREEQDHRYSRAALRKITGGGAIWECEHRHDARGYFSDGAMACANQEHWRRCRDDARPAPERRATDAAD